MTETRLISDLIEDPDLYPRHGVDAAHQSRLVAAIESGVDLPPVVIDAETNRIVDGWHRTRAHRSVYGADAAITVEARHYSSEADIIADAVAANAGHGRPFDSQDRTRAALMLQQAGFDNEQVARTLNITVQRVEQATKKVAVVRKKPEPAKPIAWPQDGKVRKLNAQQAEVMRSSSGWRPSQTMRQLARELEVGLVDLDDPNNVDALRELYVRCSEALASVTQESLA